MGLEVVLKLTCTDASFNMFSSMTVQWRWRVIRHDKCLLFANSRKSKRHFLTLRDLAGTWGQISGMCSQVCMSNISRKKKKIVICFGLFCWGFLSVCLFVCLGFVFFFLLNGRCILTSEKERSYYSLQKGSPG